MVVASAYAPRLPPAPPAFYQCSDVSVIAASDVTPAEEAAAHAKAHAKDAGHLKGKKHHGRRA